MKKRTWIIAGLAAATGLAILLLAGILLERTVYGKAPAAAAAGKTPSPAELAKAVRGLEARLKVYEPKGLIIVIDTAANLLTLKKAGKTVKEYVVSCGSGGLLEDPAGNKFAVWEPDPLAFPLPEPD